MFISPFQPLFDYFHFHPTHWKILWHWSRLCFIHFQFHFDVLIHWHTVWLEFLVTKRDDNNRPTNRVFTLTETWSTLPLEGWKTEFCNIFCVPLANPLQENIYHALNKSEFYFNHVKIGKETNMKIHSNKYEHCFNSNPEVSPDQKTCDLFVFNWGYHSGLR